ncbi:MAG: saccharopine dehydrogenase [Promethearchaeota archaeon]|nr:MAG: saccharopine dehydrogenase [Candidatus Lokiarchaeota archaeon]
MSKICVLGGCGAVGSFSVRTLANFEDFSEIIIGDINLNQAKKLASEINSDKIKVIKVDALDPSSIIEAINGTDVVLNCTGPFYKYVSTILKTVIKAGINYVDICDDVDVTIDILKMSHEAEKANISALIGMGSSPGVTNILARFSADRLLDETESIDIYHAHGGEPIEGAGVIAHRIHAMTIDIPMFLDGKLKSVKFFEKDGIELQEDVDFHLIGTHRVYPYPHPEQITIPKYIKGLKRVTNKGTVLPEKYYNLIKEIVRLGLIGEEPINVRDQIVKPIDFAIAYIIEQREKILKETNFGQQRGALKIVTKGKRKGKPHQYIFSMASISQAMGEGTGIPAALGTILMNQGKISKKGIFAPEGGVNPLDFLKLTQKVFNIKQIGAEEKGSPFLIESIDADGKTKRITI